MKNFVITIDNEVVANQYYPNELLEKIDMSKLIAILSSDPRFILTDATVPIGYIWDGTSFSLPVD